MNDIQKLQIDIMGPGPHVRNLRTQIDHVINRYHIDHGTWDDVITEVEIVEVEATGDTSGFWRCEECDGLVRGDAQGPGHAEACSLHPDNEVGE